MGANWRLFSRRRLSSSVSWQPRYRATVHPFWLRVTGSITSVTASTAANTAAARYGLRVALLWFGVGITLALAYFVNLYRSIRGKVGEDAAGHGY